MNAPLRVGTRGSSLASAQTGQIVDRLRALGREVVVETIATRGDARGDVPVAALAGDGVFVRELERALLGGRIDVAVHSLKDMPTAAVPGLALACVPARASPFDALVGRPGDTLASLPPATVIGTSSIRRVLQVQAARPDLEIRPVRGNVDTRLARLDAGDYRCLVLAAAGLERLGLAARVTAILRPPGFWPAVGQGALGLQVRAGDESARHAVAPLDDLATHLAVLAERRCLAELAGGCLAPVAGWARIEEDGTLRLGARVLEHSGGVVREVVAEDASPAADPGAAEALGRRVAAALVAAGAAPMLERMRAQATAHLLP